MIKPVSVWKYSIGALAIVIVLNILLILIFKLSGIAVTMGISAGVGFLLGGWFAKSVGRVPLPQERSHILWQYGGILAVIVIVILGIASLKKRLLFLDY